MRSPSVLTKIGFMCAVLSASSEQTQAESTYGQKIVPLLKTHCVRCHGVETQEGGVRLDTLSTDVVNERAAAEHWHEVLNVLGAGEMPPEDEPQLSTADFNTLRDWVSSKVDEAIEARHKTDGRVVMRRLGRAEYQNTMRDLLDIDMDFSGDLPPDAISPDGFTNDGRFLQMSALQLEYYLAAARRALDRVIVVGEAPEVYRHEFSETKINHWLGDAQRSSVLGRQQEFLAKITDDYPDQGEFSVKVKFSADLKQNIGFPLLEVSVGYCPDTQILVREFAPIEITSPEVQTMEWRGRLEEFPLPVRGQGKFPGLVIRVRNVYDDGSPLPKQEKDEKKQTFYAIEPHLPTLTIASLEFQAPVFDTWPPTSHRRILFESPLREQDEVEYAREVIIRFMTRAFRRPMDRPADEVAKAQVDRLHAHFRTIRPEFPSFEETMRETLAMVLIQPDFLYLLEPAGDEKRQLTDSELASRLSYFMWSTMPDERLAELSASGKLRDSETLAAETLRLLSDERAERFVDQFTQQWLHLSDMDSIAVSKDRYPAYDDRLKNAMRGETRAFFGYLLRENLSALQLLDSEFTMLNERLAKHYGSEGIYGQEFRRTEWDTASHRGGLLTHASVLLLNSTGADSHPVRRAVWLRDRLLGDRPAPPPPDVPSLEAADPGFHELSIREQLAIHRKKAACASCHRNIDPWGIALENFDALGLWRDTMERKKDSKTESVPVVATSALPGDIELSGIDGLKRHLLKHHTNSFARSLVSRMLTYAVGRRLELSDQPAIDDLVNRFDTDEYRLQNLVISIVGHPVFQTK
ncbi:MAG: DUF1592 domain-containing protein [Fuerstiella sp.]|nr:DUF1592 domain-containing protein [Fuerstiella sp.]